MRWDVVMDERRKQKREIPEKQDSGSKKRKKKQTKEESEIEFTWKSAYTHNEAVIFVSKACARSGECRHRCFMPTHLLLCCPSTAYAHSVQGAPTNPISEVWFTVLCCNSCVHEQLIIIHCWLLIITKKVMVIFCHSNKSNQIDSRENVAQLSGNVMSCDVMGPHGMGEDNLQNGT